VLVPFGTRPEIIKLAPVVAALRGRDHEVTVLATGQHDLPVMTSDFYAEFGLWPDEQWELPSDPARRLGEAVARAAGTLSEQRDRFDVVLVLGDTFTIPVFALAARRASLPLAHLEAGLRSGNPTSMEEVNRRIGAACASLHLAPTALAAQLLRAEGIGDDRIEVVGNPIVDVLTTMGVPRAAERRGVLVTAHRATNVDDERRLAAVVDIVVGLGSRLGSVTFPVHPRTADRLRETGLGERLVSAPGVTLTEPLGYRSLLEVLAGSRVVMTDSGGLQEEAAWFGVPVAILRRSTPRWEGVIAGTAALVGLDVERALEVASAMAEPNMQEKAASAPCPYGDGRTGERVAQLLNEPRVHALLALEEPDFIGHLPAWLPRQDGPGDEG
jgi:UDP-N-acetylglucosamine 2-epimerase (non-hydrolysing)